MNIVNPDELDANGYKTYNPQEETHQTRKFTLSPISKTDPFDLSKILKSAEKTLLKISPKKLAKTNPNLY